MYYASLHLYPISTLYLNSQSMDPSPSGSRILQVQELSLTTYDIQNLLYCFGEELIQPTFTGESIFIISSQ